MAERMWCTACGTVTPDQICDCNRFGIDHEMYREPHFVNYADAMQEAAREQAQDVAALAKALEDIVQMNPLTGHLECRQTKVARAALSQVYGEADLTSDIAAPAQSQP